MVGGGGGGFLTFLVDIIYIMNYITNLLLFTRSYSWCEGSLSMSHISNEVVYALPAKLSRMFLRYRSYLSTPSFHTRWIYKPDNVSMNLWRTSAQCLRIYALL